MMKQNDFFTEESYQSMIEGLLESFPSFQKVGKEAYNPGLGNMEFFDQLAGHPHRSYKTIHVAGTNGKGSVCNMLCSLLSASGLKVGLYTSPHIIDFRERIRVLDTRAGDGYRLIGKKDVWDFVTSWQNTFFHIGMSFFEITTAMAFDWFAKEKVDVAVVETGLGGRLDSTNIITPEMSVITNIGLDHCDILGSTLPEIAFEKAGIIKPRVPVVVGEGTPEINDVFERKVLYTNLPEAEYMGDRKKIMSLLTFADASLPIYWDSSDEILSRMDEQGSYQRANLRTVLCAAQVLAASSGPLSEAVTGLLSDKDKTISAIVNTASRTGFRGRWEILSRSPFIIADIGHNAHGLRYNFKQLEAMRAEGKCTHILMVYGMVSDKDVDAVFELMPKEAKWFFTNAVGKRALPAADLQSRYLDYCTAAGVQNVVTHSFESVAEAVFAALDVAEEIVGLDPSALPLIYVGGSTYVVAEAIRSIDKTNVKSVF